MPKKIGIILVNYKDYAQNFLPACRDSLRAQSYPREALAVYIIDNASTPNSRRFLADSYPEAQIIERPDGNYCAANNAGARAALADGCDYFVAANMDTEFKPRCLAELAAALDNNPAAGIAQAKILLYPRDDQERKQPLINTIGNQLHYLGFGFTSAYREPDREIDGYPEIAGYTSGCCFIARREVFERGGGWNEEYYMYHDDIEFSLKAKLAGYKIILAPLAVIYHKYEFSRSVRMLYYMERNRYLLLLSFYPAAVLIALAPALLLMAGGLFVFALAGGWLKTWFKVAGYFLRLRTWRLIVKERKALKLIKRISFSEIARSFQSEISFLEVENSLLKYVGNPCLRAYWRLIRIFI